MQEHHPRSYFGVISDRFADGLDSILVVGDTTFDIDTFYRKTKERDGFPVLESIGEQSRFGCSEAIANMIRAMGQRAVVASDREIHPIKHRIIVDDKVLCRLDNDMQCSPPGDLPPAKIVLIADYAKGVVTEHTMARVAKLYAGKEIIADWHPSRTLDFYQGATAIKASWNAPFPDNDPRPYIRTKGAGGMTVRADGKVATILARNQFAIDPCGAGDMVLATLGVGRMRGLSWWECCYFASENAAEVCRHWGSVAKVSESIMTAEGAF